MLEEWVVPDLKVVAKAHLSVVAKADFKAVAKAGLAVNFQTRRFGLYVEVLSLQ